MIFEAFKSIYMLTSKNTLVMQIVGFKKKSLLDKYLLMMELSGFREIHIKVNNKETQRIWRKVRHRSFYASSKGDLDSANEVLLIHKKEANGK